MEFSQKMHSYLVLSEKLIAESLDSENLFQKFINLLGFEEHTIRN